MPQSLARLITHIIFSTKDREPFIRSDIRDDLHAYLGGTADRAFLKRHKVEYDERYVWD